MYLRGANLAAALVLNFLGKIDSDDFYRHLKIHRSSDRNRIIRSLLKMPGVYRDRGTYMVFTRYYAMNHRIDRGYDGDGNEVKFAELPMDKRGVPEEIDTTSSEEQLRELLR